MKTTMREIETLRPCSSRWKNAKEQARKLLGNDYMDIEITPIQILDAVGIKDAIWCFNIWDYEDYCLFLADVVESILHIFEKHLPDDNRPRKCIQAIRDYHAGKITRDHLKDIADASDFAVVSSNDVATNAAADAIIGAASAVYVAYIAADADYDYVAQKQKWKEIENLFRQHFNGGK